MGLYPDILFHFTGQHNLNRILNETFKLSYARERISAGTKLKQFGVPMVSFSDLRLSELKEHIGNYGKFGIGLTKEWAIRSRLNPVMYASHQSNFTESFFDAIDVIFKHLETITDAGGTLSLAYNNTLNTLRYIKNYKGDLIRPGKNTLTNYVFANEREWRYIPKYDNSFLAFAPIDRIQTSAQKAQLNQQVNHIKLPFQPDDIKYLIVEKDSDINPLISHLRVAKIHFSKDTIDRLASRILTSEQILNDV